MRLDEVGWFVMMRHLQNSSTETNELVCLGSVLKEKICQGLSQVWDRPLIAHCLSPVTTIQVWVMGGACEEVPSDLGLPGLGDGFRQDF